MLGMDWKGRGREIQGQEGVGFGEDSSEGEGAGDTAPSLCPDGGTQECRLLRGKILSFVGCGALGPWRCSSGIPER